MDPDSRPPLTIGELSHRTGVPTTTLRSWETRYGFPTPVRHAGGHRRYSESDVDAVLAVLDRRRGGLSLAAAVRLAGPVPAASDSVFAELRRRHPMLVPQLLSHRTLVALSHAIEDECGARAARPLLFGGFQRETYLQDSLRRWTDLARTARCAVVFADFAGAPSHERPGLVEVAVPPDSPMAREWLVVCDATDLPACLSAVERPGQHPGASGVRRFEAVWSVDPQVVHDASQVAAALADRYRPGWRPATTSSDLPPAPASADLHRAAQLFDRMVQYLDERR